MPTRRTVLAGLLASAAVPGMAWAVSPQAAEKLVNQLSADITRTINAGKSESAMLADFKKIFEKYADVPTIARFSLGVAARSASASDLRAYTNAYAGYVSRKYGRRFNEFVGGQIVVTGSSAQKNFVVVDAVAKLRGQSDARVQFQVSDRSGRDKFVNVIIEGINMLTTERTEIGSLLDSVGGSVPRLTAKLKTL